MEILYINYMVYICTSVIKVSLFKILQKLYYFSLFFLHPCHENCTSPSESKGRCIVHTHVIYLWDKFQTCSTDIDERTENVICHPRKRSGNSYVRAIRSINLLHSCQTRAITTLISQCQNVHSRGKSAQATEINFRV